MLRRTLSVALSVFALLTISALPAHTVATPRSSGGTEGLATDGRAAMAPGWMGAVFDASTQDAASGLRCGASLVAAQWLLTAGHCVDGLAAEDVQVVMGAGVLGQADRLEAAEIVIHPDYDPDRTRGDLALIRLADRVEYPPVELASADDLLTATPGSAATLYGWGATDPNGSIFPEQLQSSDVIVRADAACRENAHSDPHAAVRLCAGQQNAGACAGDSGGPLIAAVDDRQVQVGVVSAGVDPCGSSAYDEYVETAAYRPWIASVTGLGTAPLVTRVGGTVEEVSVMLSRLSYGSGHSVAFLATSSAFPDGLAGGALAAGIGPLLLTPSDAIPTAVLAELQRLGPRRIMVLGGQAAVSAQAQHQLEGIASVTRIAGEDRYATAAAVAGAWVGDVRRVFVATGANYPDALAAVPVAFGDGPVLLSRANGVPAVTLAAIAELQPEEIVLLGGEAVLHDAVARQLEAFAPTRRLAGSNRYATAASVATDATAFTDPPFVFVTSGRGFGDALAAGVAAARFRSPLLLADGPLPAAVDDALVALHPDRAVVVGSDERLPHEVFTALDERIRQPQEPQ